MIDNKLTHEIFDVTSLLLGAGHSIDVLTSDVERWTLPIDQESLLSLVDSRMKLRYIIRTPWMSSGNKVDPRDNQFLKGFGKLVDPLQSKGWEVRLVNLDPTINCIIVDQERAVLSNVPSKGDSAHSFLVESDNGLDSLVGHFERLWRSAISGTDIEIVHEDLLQSSIPTIGSQIAEFSSRRWDDLILRLSEQPRSVYQLPPREFEELIAELISREGFGVQLTQATRDGGRDILATLNSQFGQHLYLVECKRYSEENPLSVRIVREFYGVISQSHAVSGMLVTSSFYTKPALQFASTIRMRMVLKDFRDLSAWIKQHASKGGRFV